jgi:Icc protein
MTERATARGWWRVAIVLGLVVVATAPAGASPARPVVVDITQFAYAPPVLTVAAGTSVTWINHDEESHTVTSSTCSPTRARAMGALGGDQIEWLEHDLAPLSASTPVVVFAHVPLWAVYPQWGWVTEDAARALVHLRRFGSVTVLNGHIHQVLQKVEGNVTFHTAMSTAFPQPAPGSAPAPRPMKIPEAEARRLIGVTEARYVPGPGPLAIVDTTLG